MARIHLDGVGHAYAGGGPYALERADVLFEEGRTYALLGPSGCGKTTMLNIVSGLLTPSDGRVMIGGRDVTNVPTAARNIAQVFQFPVIYRSKTVFENLAFPLRCRNVDNARIRQRVAEVADMLGLASRLSRSARNLTADEKQLVSLGRGLVRDDVAALLMDEPLTVIDPQMKLDLRRRIKQANDRTRHTVVYVTHDQNEAMTFADEVLVMRSGRVVQRGTPEELFERPAEVYVGNFIGSPGMNFVPAENRGGTLLVGNVPILAGLPAALGDGEVTLGIRPEHLRLARDGEPGVAATIRSVQDQGTVRVVEFDLAAARLKLKLPRRIPIPEGEVEIAIPRRHARFYRQGILLDVSA